MTGRNINIEGLIRIRAGPIVSDPVGANVVWIKGIQVSSREDEVRSGAIGIRIDGRTQRCAAVVYVGVGIVMVRKRIKDRARRAGRTGLRNTAAEEPASLYGTIGVDASGKRTWRAGRTRRARCRSRWRRRRRAAAAQPCYSQRVHRTACVMILAYHHNKGLPVGYSNTE